MLDSRERLEFLRNRVDLVEVASRYTGLRRVRHQYIGLCPLHLERHPSFYVHPEKKIFFCFGCGRGGDVFAFVKALLGCDFREAVRQVARLAQGRALSFAREARLCIGARGVGGRRPPQTTAQPEEVASLRRKQLLRYAGEIVARDAELPPCMRSDFLLVTNRITLPIRQKGARL